MKKNLVALVIAMTVFSVAFSQEKKLKVVWDIADADTTTTAGVFRQVNNALALVPDMEIELVFHGPAIYAMVKDSTVFTSRIVSAKQRGVQLSVCNNSMRRLKVDASQLVQEAGIVPSAVVELIRKQAEGWSYLKAGH